MAKKTITHDYAANHLKDIIDILVQEGADIKHIMQPLMMQLNITKGPLISTLRKGQQNNGFIVLPLDKEIADLAGGKYLIRVVHASNDQKCVKKIAELLGA